MRYLIYSFIFLAAFAVVILYSALIVASDVDEKEQKYWEKKGQIK